MSRLPMPKTIQKPSSVSQGTGGGKISNIKKPTSTNGTKKKTEFEPAPMSIPLKPPKKEAIINWEDLRKKTIRRNAPEGEDKKELIRVIKSLKGQIPKITVHEFINLVSPFTGDNGATFRSIMEEDLASFRKLTKKIYDTMTQDVSDVLINEQMQMTAFYQNRNEMLQEKLAKMINEIYAMAPEFKFEEFNKDRELYLNMILPIPKGIQRKAEDVEMQRRQQAFHRVQWLKIEGERLAEENRRLQSRLNDLKQQQLDEQAAAAEAVVLAETKKKQLQAEEAKRIEILDALNESIGKTMVRTEAFINTQTNTEARHAGALAANKAAEEKGAGAIKKKHGEKGKKKRKPKPEWISSTATDIEETAVTERLNAQVAQFDEMRMRQRRSHYPSPMKNPQALPPQPPRAMSSFGYSPSRDEPMPEMAPVIQSTIVEHNTTSLQEPRAAAHKGRRGMAPKDSWGGFY